MVATETEQHRLWLTSQRCLCYTSGLVSLRSGCQCDGVQLRLLGWFATDIIMLCFHMTKKSRRGLFCNFCKGTNSIMKVLSLGSNYFLMALSLNTVSLGIRIPIVNSVTRQPVYTIAGSMPLQSVLVCSYNECLLYCSFLSSKTKYPPSN